MRANPTPILTAQYRLPTVWQTLSMRGRTRAPDRSDRGGEEPMQELQQRAAWDGKIFVDGEFRAPDGGGTLTVLDKAAQEPLGTAGVGSTADVDAAVRAAQRAQPGWAAEPYDVRAGVMRAAAAELQRRADEIATLLVRETGCIRGKAEYEVGGAANELFEAAGLTSRATASIIPSHNPTRVSIAERIPRCVIGCLTPWNFPLVL